MEVVHHSLGDDDVISRMPDNVIANIMDCLPLKDAVATSILSPSWRFKWTLLTRLIFNGLPGRFDKSDISRLLLHLKQVTKFVLTISDIKLDDADIHHWILFLSRIRGFKELTLVNLPPTLLKLPSHLFSCLDLKHLKLYDCVLSPPPPYFHGFPKLLTLDMYMVIIQDHTFGDLITQCPLLETLKIQNSDLLGQVKLVEIAKLKNLKMLRLTLCWLDIHMTMVRLSTVFQHLSLLPKLQKLCLNFENCEFLPEDVAQAAVSSTFPLLKSLKLYHMDFSSVSMISCALGMIFGCTNLQTLSIIAMYKNVVPLPTIFPAEVDSNTMGKLQLQNVKLVFIKGSENEVCLIKYLLACSPMLESIKIILDSSIKINVNEKYKFANKLLKLHRTSPIAEVVII